MKTFKVLSVDFDFFQSPTLEEIRNYPDGIDLPTELTEITWAIHKKETENVKLAKTFYKQLLQILKKQSPDIPVLLANSHIHTYNFIAENSNNRPIELYNIDLHHDIINENPKLDCGNWVKHLLDNFKVSKFAWITRKLSVKIYGIEPERYNAMHIQFDFNEIKNMQFDAISIARSDNWTPPHLDIYFDNILSLCKSRFNNAVTEKCVMKPRTIQDINTKVSHID